MPDKVEMPLESGEVERRRARPFTEGAGGALGSRPAGRPGELQPLSHKAEATEESSHPVGIQCGRGETWTLVADSSLRHSPTWMKGIPKHLEGERGT